MPLAYYSRAADRLLDRALGQPLRRGAAGGGARGRRSRELIEAHLPSRRARARGGLRPRPVRAAAARARPRARWARTGASRRCGPAPAGAPAGGHGPPRAGRRATAPPPAYLSLGVVEHDPAGPDAILAEARARAGRRAAWLLLSVPYWNGVRRLVAPVIARARPRDPRGGRPVLPVRVHARASCAALWPPHGFAVRGRSIPTIPRACCARRCEASAAARRLAARRSAGDRRRARAAADRAERPARGAGGARRGRCSTRARAPAPRPHAPGGRG